MRTRFFLNSPFCNKAQVFCAVSFLVGSLASLSACSKVDLPRVGAVRTAGPVTTPAPVNVGQTQNQRERMNRVARSCDGMERSTSSAAITVQEVERVSVFLQETGISLSHVRRAYVRGHKKALRLIASMLQSPVISVTLLAEVEAALLKEDQTPAQHFFAFQNLGALHSIPAACVSLLNQVWLREWIKTFDPYARFVVEGDRENAFTLQLHSRNMRLGLSAFDREYGLLKLRGDLDSQTLTVSVPLPVLNQIRVIDLRAAFGFSDATRDYFARLLSVMGPSTGEAAKVVLVWDDLTAGWSEFFAQQLIDRRPTQTLTLGDGIAAGMTAGYLAKPTIQQFGQQPGAHRIQTGLGQLLDVTPIGRPLVAQLVRSFESRGRQMAVNRAYPWAQVLLGDEGRQSVLLTSLPWLAIESLYSEFESQRQMPQPLQNSATLQQRINLGLSDQALFELSEVWRHD